MRPFDPVRIADETQANTKEMGKDIAARGEEKKVRRQERIATAMRDQITKDNIGFKSNITRRAKKMPVSLPKVGDT